MNRRIKILCALLFVLATIQNTYAGQSEDYLECDLANGDQFILINKYDYSPLARFTRHGASRTNEFGFKAYYKPTNSKIIKSTVPTPSWFFHPTSLTIELARKKACALYSRNQNYLRAVGSVIHFENNKVVISNPIFPSKEFRDNIYELAKNKRLNQLFSHDYNDGNQTQVEFAIIESAKEDWESPIVSVIQTQSTDNGQTWSDPIITKDAKLFEIGKSILDQPAVAKPGKWKKGPG